MNANVSDINLVITEKNWRLQLNIIYATGLYLKNKTKTSCLFRKYEKSPKVSELTHFLQKNMYLLYSYKKCGWK